MDSVSVHFNGNVKQLPAFLQGLFLLVAKCLVGF